MQCQVCARCYLNEEITKQEQAKLTRPKKISPIAFLDVEFDVVIRAFISDYNLQQCKYQ